MRASENGKWRIENGDNPVSAFPLFDISAFACLTGPTARCRFSRPHLIPEGHEPFNVNTEGGSTDSGAMAGGRIFNVRIRIG
jgi:hypothetical protein